MDRKTFAAKLDDIIDDAETWIAESERGGGDYRKIRAEMKAKRNALVDELFPINSPAADPTRTST